MCPIHSAPQGVEAAAVWLLGPPWPAAQIVLLHSQGFVLFLEGLRGLEPLMMVTVFSWAVPAEGGPSV